MRLMAAIAAVVLVGCLDANDKFMEATESESSPPGSTTGGPPPPTSEGPEPGESSSTTPPPTQTTSEPVCGNGVEEAGEGCDDGDDDDTNACTNACQPATCGDGIVHAGVEACDDGDDDNGNACVEGCKFAVCGDDFLYVGKEECDDGNDVGTDDCTTECKDPACGDGFLWDMNEECDDENLDPWDGCEPDCVMSEFWVFVTSAKSNGDLGGLAGADMKCNLAAMEAQLEGPIKYKAWLSDNMTAAAARIEHGLGRYRRTDDVIVAESWDQLTSGQLEVAINRTEFEGPPPAATNPGQVCGGSTSLVFTNTTTNGGQNMPMFDCNKWGVPTGPAAFGDPMASDDAWTDTCEWMPMEACATLAPIYCVQEPM